MPIKRTTPMAEIQQFINSRLEAMERVIIRNLCYVGESCRNEAIMKHKYKNQTGNLESSTGYVVSVDGQIVQLGGFTITNDGDKGQQSGRSYAEELAKAEKKGYCLILVAGMSYAKYVSDRGYDVLDSAELLAKQLVPKMMETMKF